MTEGNNLECKNCKSKNIVKKEEDCWDETLYVYICKDCGRVVKSVGIKK